MSQQTFFGKFHFVSSFRSILYKHCGLWNVEIAAFKPQRSLAITTAIAHLAFVAMACSNCDMQRYAKICRIQIQTAPNWHRQRRNAATPDGQRISALPVPGSSFFQGPVKMGAEHKAHKAQDKRTLSFSPSVSRLSSLSISVPSSKHLHSLQSLKVSPCHLSNQKAEVFTAVTVPSRM